LVGVYDRSRERAEAVTKQFGGRVFATPEELLAECEAVSVATPTIAHLEAAQQALAAGCHVLVEKPMAVTVAECDAMIAAAERAGRVLSSGSGRALQSGAARRTAVRAGAEVHRRPTGWPHSSRGRSTSTWSATS
jgi:predicted dehydrogenase